MTTALIDTMVMASPTAMSTAGRWIEGQTAALALLKRVDDDTALPGDLALLLASRKGEAFLGACAAVEKKLRGRHA